MEIKKAQKPIEIKKEDLISIYTELGADAFNNALDSLIKQEANKIVQKKNNESHLFQNALRNILKPIKNFWNWLCYLYDCGFLILALVSFLTFFGAYKVITHDSVIKEAEEGYCKAGDKYKCLKAWTESTNFEKHTNFEREHATFLRNLYFLSTGKNLLENTDYDKNPIKKLDE